MSPPTAWAARVGCVTVRGAQHRRHRQASQDAAACRPAAGASPWSLAAVADGHGDPACRRSRAGARLAVDTALAHLDGLARAGGEEELVRKQFLQPEWSEDLARRWRHAVAADVAARPPRRAERARAQTDFPALYPAILYGTTLLAGMAGPAGWFFLQLGDGDALAVWRNGSVERLWPRPPDAVGDQTESLCQPDAGRRIHRAALPATGELPELALLATDGYSRSFASDGDFLQVGEDLLNSLRHRGWSTTMRQLPGWLRETTEAGSGDDISVAIFARA